MRLLPKMLYSLVIAQLLVLATFILTPTPVLADNANAQQLIDRIVAVVNKGIITQRQLNEKTAAVIRQLQGSGQTLPSHKVLERQVLKRMIIDKLELQAAKRMGISIDQDTFNNTLRTIAANNNMSLSQLHQRVASSGESWHTFTKNVRDRLIIQKVQQQEISNQIHISHQDIRNFLAQHANQMDPGVQYHLAQILIPIPSAASPKQVQAALNKAETLRKKIDNGASFSKLAIANSSGQNALKGGKMGWMTSDKMPTYFVRTVNVLKTGEVSHPIRSPSGYHLVKLLGMRGGKQTKITEYKVRQILITPNGNLSNAQAKAKIEHLRKEIEKGTNFAKLAESNSMDPGSAANGGKLGWLNPSQVIPQFKKVMESLPLHKLSKPFHSPFGWHLIEVMGKRQVSSTEKMLRAQAKKILYQRKRNETLNIWLRRLHAEAYINIRLHQKEPSKSNKAS